jgi:transporter family protein
MTGNWIPWALSSAAFAGLTAVLAKVGVAGINPNLATAIRTTVILVFTWSVAAGTATISFSGISRQSWTFLLLSGVATGLSWLCYFRALQLGEASRVAPVDKLSVIFAIVLAAMFLGEQFTIKKMIGGALIAAGAVILAL